MIHITRSAFESAMSLIKKNYDRANKLYDTLYSIGVDVANGEEGLLGVQTAIDAVCALVGGEGHADTISFFIYDLNWGSNWLPGDFSIDGADFPLNTVTDLYSAIELTSTGGQQSFDVYGE